MLGYLVSLGRCRSTFPTCSVRGDPGSGYPCPWSVLAWIEGSHPVPDRLSEPQLLATDLAALVRAFHDIDLPNPPAAYRGPVAEMDDPVRQCIVDVTDEFDPAG